MLLKIMNRAWLRYVILIFMYSFYNQAVYATCAGLGCSCSVATTAVTFGNYNPISVTATTANGNVAVTCSALVIFTASYVISMAKGNSATYTPRFMNLAGVHLNYNLYTTAGFASIWGDATGGTVTVSDSYTAIGLSDTRNYTVFGQIPAVQTIGAGTYTDTILVTVTY
jgi:spore coat protein U domain-containing protein, fimbrial subunit CupE1/2/3/6